MNSSGKPKEVANAEFLESAIKLATEADAAQRDA